VSVVASDAVGGDEVFFGICFMFNYVFYMEGLNSWKGY